MLEVTKE